jgi:hypothetical protein
MPRLQGTLQSAREPVIQRRNRTSTSNPDRVIFAIEIAIRSFFVKAVKRLMTTSTDGLKVKQISPETVRLDVSD